VHTPNGVIEFLPSERGLHYLDMKEQGEAIQHMLVTAEAIEDESENKDEPEHEEYESIEKNDYMMVNTMQKNFEGYTKHDVKKAQEAKCLQGMTRSPTDREFAGMVRENLIANCPVTVHDVHNANHIFGPNLANLRGKTTRSKPEHVRVEYIKVPRNIIHLHKYVTIVADVMFVNGLPFMVTSSRGISLITIQFLPSRTAKSLANSITRVLQIYGRAGFVVQTSLMDMEFEKLKDLIPQLTINTMAAQEHVGEIERRIRVIKERARGTMIVLPYEALPKLMLLSCYISV
jgi:hypothetical protein